LLCNGICERYERKLSQCEGDEGWSGMNGDETEKNKKVIRKERRRIVRRLSHESSMQKQEGNGGRRCEINYLGGQTKSPPVPDCLSDEIL